MSGRLGCTEEGEVKDIQNGKVKYISGRKAHTTKHAYLKPSSVKRRSVLCWRVPDFTNEGPLHIGTSKKKISKKHDFSPVLVVCLIWVANEFVSKFSQRVSQWQGVVDYLGGHKLALNKTSERRICGVSSEHRSPWFP